MKKIAAVAVVLLALPMFALNGCGGGGGGGGTGLVATVVLKPPVANLTGSWSVRETSGTNTCGDPVGVVDTYTALVIHDKSNSLTLTNDSTGQSLVSTVSGSTVSYSGSGFDPSCSSFSMSMNLTINTEQSLSGSTSWTCYYGGTSCSGTDAVVATRQGPIIVKFSPMSGPTGTTVTISGTNFSSTPASNAVKFHGTSSVVTKSTVTSLTTTVPAGATTGTVSLTVSGQTFTSLPLFTVTSSLAAEAEPNNASGTAQTIAVGTTINGTSTGSYYEGTADFDWYKFTPSTTRSYTITLSFGTNADMDMYLFNAGLSSVAQSIATGFGGTETITTTLTGGSAYYLSARPYDAWDLGGTTNYTLTIQ